MLSKSKEASVLHKFLDQGGLKISVTSVGLLEYLYSLV